MSYINNSNGWSNQHTNHVANKVDHLADKISFAVDMVANAAINLDGAQQELLTLANAPYPPQSTQLITLANRIAANKRQIDDGLAKIKEMARTIDQETNQIQTPPQRGW
ncbi:hypothetical protein [Brevibacillus formosus]|uniref:hypothetical protein n=1 Tax=Brevibacillus formosus TaxID=54913 RepID=UPI003F19D820